MFVGEELKALQAHMTLFQRLLQYFDPELSNCLEALGVGPELYLSPWLLTMFASKIEDISVVFRLWEAYMRENDPIFNLFLSLALVISHRQRILTCEASIVAQLLTQVTIHDEATLKRIVKAARGLKGDLPYSAYIALLRYPLDTISELDSILETVGYSKVLSVLPREVVRRCYASSFVCPCVAGTCLWCRKSSKEVAMIVIDCRLPEEKEAGKFPKTYSFNPSVLEYKALKRLTEKLAHLKGLVHIVVFGSNCPFAVDAGDMAVEKIYSALIRENFKYISVVDGGYRDIHDLALQFNLTIEGHDTEFCLACNPDSRTVGFNIKRKMNNLRKTLVGKVRVALSFAETTLLRQSSGGAERSLEGLSAQSFSDNPSTRVFKCRKLDRSSRKVLEAEYCLCVTSKDIVLSNAFEEISLSDTTTDFVVETAEMKNLLKITSKLKFLNTLTFYFRAGNKELKRSYVFWSAKDSKRCISIVRGYFNALMPHSYSGFV